MLYLPHAHWLWSFGAIALGIATGWLIDIRAATRMIQRPAYVGIGIGAAAAVAIAAALTEFLLSRYEARIELGATLAFCFVIGGFIGWALRDLADYMPVPADTGVATVSGAASGSYLFRDAFAGLGSGGTFVRTAAASAQSTRTGMALGSVARRRATPADALGIASTSSTFAGSKGGYIYPAAAERAPFADALRAGTTRTGQYRHWSWRGAGSGGELISEAPETDEERRT